MRLLYESSRRLTDDFKASIPNVDWVAIIGMRNLLVHEYFGIDPDIIRDVIDTKLGPLAEALRTTE